MILLRFSNGSKSQPLDLLFIGMAFVFVVHLSMIGVEVEAGPGSEIRDDTDLFTMTKAEIKGLEKLKHKVLPQLTDYFMRTDYYLIRWLRMTNLDVERAKDLIIEDINWRERANIKGILDEDFSDISQDYELTLGEDSSDFFGRPVGTLPLGDWKLRDAIVLGKKPRLQRYLTQSLEKGMFTMIYRLLQTNQTVASAIMLIDGEGGNVLQHLCGQCLGILAEWLWTMETHYPKGIKELILINAPRITAIGMQVLKPIMSKDTFSALKIFDTNKKVWMAYLDQRIPRNQRTRRYGGTRPDH